VGSTGSSTTSASPSATSTSGARSVLENSSAFSLLVAIGGSLALVM
jgi:hypothetical protein